MSSIHTTLALQVTEMGIGVTALIYLYRCWQCLPPSIVLKRGSSRMVEKGASVIKGSCCSWAGDDDKQPVQYITTPFVLVARDINLIQHDTWQFVTRLNQKRNESIMNRAFKITLSRVAAQRLTWPTDSFFSTPQYQVVLWRMDPH